MKIYVIIALSLFLCFTKQSSAQPTSNEDFNPFLKHFFADSVFQKTRILFPFHEHPSYLDPKTDKPVATDTVTCKDKSEWKYITSDGGEKGSKYTVYTDTLRKGKKNMTSEYRVLDYEKEETDFNLVLILKLINHEWKLIRIDYFEP